MKLEELAISVLDAVESTGVPFMAVGAIAAGRERSQSGVVDLQKGLGSGERGVAS